MTDRHPALADELIARTSELAQGAADRYLQQHPEMLTRFPTAHERCIEDGRFHLQHLAAALAMGRQELFDEYLAWATELLEGLGIDRAELDGYLRTLLGVIDDELHGHDTVAVRELVHGSVAALSDRVAANRLTLTDDLPHGSLAKDFLDALLRTDRHTAIAQVLQAADDGVPIQQLYLDVFQPCLYEVGRLWQTGEASVAQEHFVSAAVQLAMAQLYPRLFATPRIGRAIVVASVGGELHEIGGRMVADIFELHGWDAHFTGANTPSHSVARLASDVGADAVAISATIPSHLPAVEEVVRAVREAVTVPILVGGRPFNQVPELWQVVGADASAPDAVAAVGTTAALVNAA